MHLDQATQIVTTLTSAWPGGPPVEVVFSHRDLPIPAYDDVRGVYFPPTAQRPDGKVMVVAASQSAFEVPRTVAHEVLAHHGLRLDLGQSWKSFMNAVQAGARGDDTRLSQLRSYIRDVYVDDNGEPYLRPVHEADEVAANLVERRFSGKLGRLAIPNPWKMRATAAIAHFDREILYSDRPASFEELQGRLLAAEHVIRHGGRFWGIGARLQRWYASAMSKPWNPKAAPMSLRESENLLKADADGKKSKDEWLFLWEGFKLIAAIVLFPVGIIAILYSLYINFSLIFG